MPTSGVRRLDWAPRALQAYVDSLAHIADEDPRTAALIQARVEHALDLILQFPEIGVAAARRSERRLDERFRDSRFRAHARAAFS